MSDGDVVIDLTEGVTLALRHAYKLGAVDQMKGQRVKDDDDILARILNVIQGKEDI